jgi:hypothetical protein
VRLLTDDGSSDDDKIQELFFKVKQIDVNPATIRRSEEPPSESKVLDGKISVSSIGMIGLSA